jgi:hypothetical protein
VIECQLPEIPRATDWSRTDDLRFTKPLQAVLRGSSASIFDRLRVIDSEIGRLRQERQVLVARLETLTRGEGEE